MNTSDEPSVSIPAGQTNVYLVKNGHSSVLIDAGVKGRKEKILQSLEHYGLKPGDIRLIVLTHTHYDHSGNLKALREATGAHVLVHRNEADNLSSGYTPFPNGTKLFSKLIVSLGKLFMKKMGKYDPVEPDVVVEDQYDLNAYGVKGYILPTPGHTSGSISLILQDTYAYIGDTAFNIGGSGIYPPFANDTDELIKSWKKLLDTGCEKFYPGHGRMITRSQLEENLKKRSQGQMVEV